MIVYTRYILLCLLCFSLQQGNAHSIDSLKTNEAVRHFLHTELSEKGFIFLEGFIDISQKEKIRLYLSNPDIDTTIDAQTGKTGVVVRHHEYDPADNNCKDFPLENSVYDSVIAKMDNDNYQFYKADLDRNGRTDLVVDAGMIIVVLDMGNSFEGYLFSEVPGSIKLKNIITLPGNSKGLLFSYRHCHADTAAVDTIVYKYHSFLKYNPRYTRLGIKKIVYTYSCSAAMVGLDRNNTMQIYNDGSCYMKYDEYDTVFTASLNKEQVEDLLDMTAYIDIKSMKMEYSIGIDHGSGGSVDVYFADGTIKSIGSWVCMPPVGLCYLSKNIADISRTLNWKSTKRKVAFDYPASHGANDGYGDCGCGW